MEEIKYFNFPIPLIKNFMGDSNESLTNILYFSLMAHSKKYYGKFDEEIENKEENPDLINLKSAAKWYNVNLGNENIAFKAGMNLLKEYENQKQPTAGIPLNIFWDFYNNEKTDFEKACLLAFLAFKSILGNKSYCRTTNDFLTARMSGLAAISKGEMSPELKQFTNRYQLDKIKNELRLNWGLKFYARYTRGFYISFKMPLEELVFEAEKRRKSTKEKQLRDATNLALKKAKERLNRNSTITTPIKKDLQPP